MEYLKVGGRSYSDPDVISLIKAAGELVDPRAAVVTQARKLNQILERWPGGSDEALDPIRRLEILASIQGLTVSKMNVETQKQESRDAMLVPVNSGKSTRIIYNPTRPKGRVAFSIAHEISHTFFPTTMRGARFRAICANDTREANELERLCDLGAAELLLPYAKFRSALGTTFGLDAVPKLCEIFGSSYEATVFRMATTYEGIAMAGLLRYRLRVSEERNLQSRAAQQSLFARGGSSKDMGEFTKKYRRQSLYSSEMCRPDCFIPWNKSFDPHSCVYLAGKDSTIYRRQEALPNGGKQIGNIEAVRTPFQREDADPVFGDVLFLWWGIPS